MRAKDFPDKGSPYAIYSMAHHHTTGKALYNGVPYPPLQVSTRQAQNSNPCAIAESQSVPSVPHHSQDLHLKVNIN